MQWCKEKCSYVLTAPPHSPPASARQGKGLLLPARMQNNLIIAPREASVCRLPSGPHPILLPALCPRRGLRRRYGVRPAQFLVAQRFDRRPAILPTIPAGGPAAIPWAASAVPLPGVCLLVSPDPDPNSQHSRTVCEFDHGGQRPGQTCSASRDCLQKDHLRGRHLPAGLQRRQSLCQRRGLQEVGNEYGYCPN